MPEQEADSQADGTICESRAYELTSYFSLPILSKSKSKKKKTKKKTNKQKAFCLHPHHLFSLVLQLLPRSFKRILQEKCLPPTMTKV